MFDMGFGELLLLGAIALIAIGPKQLPEVARTVGRFLNQFRDAAGDFQRTLAQAGERANESVAEVRKTIAEATPQLPSPLDFKEHLPNLNERHHPAEPDPQTSFALSTKEAPAGGAAVSLSDESDPRQLSFDFDKKES